ncbi:MAG TPA: hypothetical protein VFE33_06280 [Thermoanaerobaculia bacterium]|nr:hypothetical protein [Thermoanaerobaculia bacterium]
MRVITYEATVENGQVKLSEEVHLPEHARVYVVVPGVETAPQYYIGSPRLARPEEVSDFIKEVIEEGHDASPEAPEVEGPIAEALQELRNSESLRTVIASEGVLRRDWEDPEEDRVWADL